MNTNDSSLRISAIEWFTLSTHLILNVLEIDLRVPPRHTDARNAAVDAAVAVAVADVLWRRCLAEHIDAEVQLVRVLNALVIDRVQGNSRDLGASVVVWRGRCRTSG